MSADQRGASHSDAAGGQAPTCEGRSAHGPCGARPLYRVTLRRSYDNERHACGRHISWLLAFVTTPGRKVEVTRL